MIRNNKSTIYAWRGKPSTLEIAYFYLNHHLYIVYNYPPGPSLPPPKNKKTSATISNGKQKIYLHKHNLTYKIIAEVYYIHRFKL